MKHCQICGTNFNAETCPNCGEATWVEAHAPVREQQSPQREQYDNRKGKR